MEEFLLPCLNKTLLGIDCYGCGGQRAFVFFLKGDFISAFKMFPAIYPLMLLLGFVMINLFFKFKYDFMVKISLILLTVGIMVINYAMKLFHFFN